MHVELHQSSLQDMLMKGLREIKDDAKVMRQKLAVAPRLWKHLARSLLQGL